MSVALVVCIKRRAGMDVAAFSRHWRDVHAPLIRGCVPFARHLLAYTQHHLADQDGPVAQMFGISGAYDGVAVLEFSSTEAMTPAFAEPAYLQQVRPDEFNFVDLEHGLCFLTEPFRVI